MDVLADPTLWPPGFGSTEWEVDAVFRALSDDHQRSIPSALAEADKPIPKAAFAWHAAAQETERRPNTTDVASQLRAHQLLHPHRLAHLESIGLIERIHAPCLATTEHPFWTTAVGQTLLTRIDETDAEMTAMFDALDDPLRRQIVRLFASHHTARLSRDALGAALTDRFSATSREHLGIRLYHAHGPALAAEGLLEYDRHTSHVRAGPRFNAAVDILAGTHGDGGEPLLTWTEVS